jgi:hypothetical protein
MAHTDQPEIPGASVPRQNRRGCLSGCLTGCLTTLLGVLAFGVAVVLLLDALLAPWTFFYGGHFHLMPGWQAWGRMHSDTAGGDYFMWIRISPSTPAYRKSPIRGIAYLCTPRGERYRLRFGGSMPRNPGTDLTGKPLHFYMYHQRLLFSLTPDAHPKIDLYGAFSGSQLIMEDRGSLATEFNADGSLHGPQERNRSRGTENVHVTFEESTPWVMSPDCPGRGK